MKRTKFYVLKICKINCNYIFLTKPHKIIFFLSKSNKSSASRMLGGNNRGFLQEVKWVISGWLQNCFNTIQKPKTLENRNFIYMLNSKNIHKNISA